MYCFHCMSELPEGSVYCSNCGKSTAVENVPPHRLLPGTILHGRYLIGEAIGEGGFGITYVGLDLQLELKIAVKEFYPHGFANRNNTVSSDVLLNYQNESSYYADAKDQFLREAKNIAKFSDENNIVDVRDYFAENNTAYIVMEYVDGVTLNQYIRDNGLFDAKEIFTKLLPVMSALKTMHSEAVIHRDVSPDNIKLTESGKLMLMDFGSARYYAGDNKRTLSVVLKPGYAPFEQYSSDGNQGPWTDVYAVCATLYKCITGKTPPDAMSRCQQDHLQPPSSLGVGIPAGLEHILMRGMAVMPQDRYHSMSELMIAVNNALSGKDTDVFLTMPAQDIRVNQGSVSAPPPDDRNNTYGDNRMYNGFDYTSERYPQKKKKHTALIVILIILIVLLIAGGVTAFFLLRSQNKTDDTSATEATQAVTEAPQTEAPKETESDIVTVPDVSNMKSTDAKTKLVGLGLKVETQTEYSDTVAKDYVIRQSIAEGRSLNKGDTILLTVSSGKEAVTTVSTDPPAQNNSGHQSIDVDSEVQTIRDWYYATQDNPGEESAIDGATYYASGGHVNKIVCPSGFNGVDDTRWYFFRNNKLYFAFVFDGAEEHRMYYANDTLIKYIDDSGMVYDYGSINCPFENLVKSEAYSLLSKY